jgi:hypothetical protein
LGLKDLRPVPWQKGLDDAYDRGRWLLTPPVDGWVLAVGGDLPSRLERAGFLDWLAGLSRTLGGVDYYCTHRVVEVHAWARAEDGKLLRAFGYVGERGETLFDAGPLTPQEEPLRAERLRWIDPLTPGEEQGRYEWWPNEETVLALAAAWSVDPRELDERELDGLPLGGR